MDHFIGSTLNPPHLELALLSTEQYNFRCMYCDEDFAIGQISPRVQAALKQFLLKRVRGIQHLVLRRTLRPSGDAMPAVLKTAVAVASEPFRLQDLNPPLSVARPAAEVA